MSFLKFPPCVCVIGDDYEILLFSKENGIFGVDVNGFKYYEENSGVLCSEKNYAKIRVPQKMLDKTKSYRVCFRKTINRKGYFSEIADEETQEFNFKPLTKTEGIKIYCVADVHYNFEIAIKTANYFGEDTDLFVFNGDLGEVETVQNYYETSEFIGNLTKGKVPAVFVRGNHDARGKLAERFTDFYPSDGKKTYYEFNIGCIKGIVLDCGEDKPDDHAIFDRAQPYVYNGVNVFSEYRKRELEWLKTVKPSKDKITMVISHICPVMATENKGDCFDIEREVYSLWNKEIERLQPSFMLCGHYHHAWILDDKDDRNIIPHEYPVIIGSELENVKYDGAKACPEKFYGAGIILNHDRAEVVFSDQNGKVKERNVLCFNDKR